MKNHNSEAYLVVITSDSDPDFEYLFVTFAYGKEDAFDKACYRIMNPKRPCEKFPSDAYPSMVMKYKDYIPKETNNGCTN